MKKFNNNLWGKKEKGVSESFNTKETQKVFGDFYTKCQNKGLDRGDNIFDKRLLQILKEDSMVEKVTKLRDFVYNEAYLVEEVLEEIADIKNSEAWGLMSDEERTFSLRELDILNYGGKGLEHLIAYKELATLHYDQGFYRDALADYKKILKANPADIFDVKYLIAALYARIHEEENLLHHIKKYNYNEDESLLLSLIIFYINDGDFNKAKRYMTVLKRLNKNLTTIVEKEFLAVSYIERDIKKLGEHNLDDLTFAFRNFSEYVLNDYHFEVLKYLYLEVEN